MNATTPARANVPTPHGVADGALSHPLQNGSSPRPATPSQDQPLTEVWTPPPQAVASAKPEFTVWRMTDFMASVPPKDDAILEIAKDQVIWREGETALLIGPGGVGKSRLALQLAVNQITGQPWVGLATCGHPRTWLFVGNENSCRRLKDELQSMLIGRALTADQFMAVQQHLLVQAPITPEDALIELDSDGGTPAAKATSGITANGRWKATLAKHRPDVLVVDPWEAVIAGSDANDSAATRQSVMELLATLRQDPTQPVEVSARSELNGQTGADDDQSP